MKTQAPVNNVKNISTAFSGMCFAVEYSIEGLELKVWKAEFCQIDNQDQ